MSIRQLCNLCIGCISTSNIKEANIRGYCLQVRCSKNAKTKQEVKPDVSEQIKKWGTQEEEASEPSKQAPCGRHMGPILSELLESQPYEKPKGYFYRQWMKGVSGSSNV